MVTIKITNFILFDRENTSKIFEEILVKTIAVVNLSKPIIPSTFAEVKFYFLGGFSKILFKIDLARSFWVLESIKT